MLPAITIPWALRNGLRSAMPFAKLTASSARAPGAGRVVCRVDRRVWRRVRGVRPERMCVCCDVRRLSRAAVRLRGLRPNAAEVARLGAQK